VDVSIKWLNFFLEDDDELENIKKVISQVYAAYNKLLLPPSQNVSLFREQKRLTFRDGGNTC
jgi:hypothetical protein